MKRTAVIAISCFVLVLGLSMNSMAFDVINLSGDPNYLITDKNVNSHNIKEDYNAKSLIPFPSHDGFAVVDLPGPIWFDKQLIFDA